MGSAGPSVRPARVGLPWRAIVGIGGAAIALLGVALVESGVDTGRLLFVIGLAVVAVGVVAALVRPGQARVAAAPPVDAGAALAELAARAGLAVEDGGVGGRVKGKRVEGHLDDAGGLTIFAEFERELDLGFSVTRGQPPGDARPRVSIEDDTFEQSYWVLADEAPRAVALLTPRLRELLLASDAAIDDRGVRVTCQPGELGRERDRFKLAARIANELERASTRSRCAEPLAEAREIWQAFAERHALATADTPLSMWGQIGGMAVRARSVRDAFQHFHFELTADFPQPLGRGLKLRPASSATQLDRSGAPIGHPAFDKVFLLKATDPVDAPRLIGPESREALLALRDTGLQLRASDEGLWAWVALNKSDYEVVPKGLERMAALARRIADNAERFPASVR